MYKNEGIISKIYDIENRVTKDGREWRKRSVKIEVDDTASRWPTFHLLELKNEAIDRIESFKVGERVRFSFSLRVRDWREREFQNVELIDIESLSSTQAEPSSDDMADIPF